MAVHNGTGPIELMCIYQIDKNEHGLVIKWYHNMEQIYQWIPPSRFELFNYNYCIK